MQRLERAHLPVLALIAAATALAYAQSFHGAWISDDLDLIADNEALRSLTLKNLRTIATTFEAGINYIPLVYLSFAFDFQLWGPNPAGFHFTNLVLHVVNAIVTYRLLLRMQESRAVAVAASLLWALHPVQVESVAWISERKNLLSTLFFLLAFDAYLRYSARPRLKVYAIVLVLYLAALLSKVNTIVLPALTLAYEVLLQKRLRARDVVASLPLFACGLALAWTNLHGNPSHGVAYHGGSFAVTLRTSSTVIPRYLWNLVAPFDLSTYYAVPLRASWSDPTVAAAVVVIGVLTASIFWLARADAPLAFWLLWFGVTLSPMLNLVPFPALMNDRYLYVPSLGIMVVLVRMAQAGMERLGGTRAQAPVLAAAAITLGVLTFLRVPVFHDPFSLWADFALQVPYISANAPYGGLVRTAEQQLLRDALARHPERAVLHNNLGAIAFEEGRLDDAIPLLARARALDPSDPAIALNLGRAYLVAGKLDEALTALQAAAALEPPSFFAHLNLATVYLRRGDLARARAALDLAKTIRTDPYLWRGVEKQIAQAEQRAM